MTAAAKVAAAWRVLGPDLQERYYPACAHMQISKDIRHPKEGVVPTTFLSPTTHTPLSLCRVCRLGVCTISAACARQDTVFVATDVPLTLTPVDSSVACDATTTNVEFRATTTARGII